MAKKQKYVRAWHFVGDKLRDGSPIPPDGEWLEYPGECVMCEAGLHWSRDPFDALQYAPGETLCLVEVDEITSEQNDKGVSHRRRIVARKDITEILRDFARMQALSVSYLWAEQDDPDDVVLYWLVTGDESARKSAVVSARKSAKVSAWKSAMVSAMVSAMESAKVSAMVSARKSAWVSAWKSAKESARTEFNSLIHAEFADVL